MSPRATARGGKSPAAATYRGDGWGSFGKEVIQ